MEPVTVITGTMVPLPRANVDTDQIMPKQFLKRVERTGYGEFVFYDWRRDEPDFVIDRPEHRDAKVLVAGANFGSGSSREHAPWACRTGDSTRSSLRCSPTSFATTAPRSASSRWSSPRRSASG